MSTGKDSSEVVVFMAKFTELKDWSDDVPDDLLELAVKDVSVKDLCVQVQEAASIFQQDELHSPSPFRAPVDPEFQKAWRDFEQRYEHLLSQISLEDWLYAGPGLPIDAFRLGPRLNPSETWNIDDRFASDRTAHIEAAIDFAEFKADDLEDEDYQADVRSGVDSWRELRQNVGLDARGAFRRRALFPRILVPRHVASKHGSAEPLPLYTLLQQAHDAFVFGAPYAALALMRSILEKILRDHYGGTEDRLDKLINQAFRFGRQKDDLHHIRKLVNAILHWDDEKSEWEKRFFSDTVEVQEKSVVLHFLVLRKLIEEAPKHR